VLLLGDHLPGHSHVAGVVSAAHAGVGALRDSGAILLLFAWARGIYVPRGRELAAACFSGLFTLGVGNGALTSRIADSERMAGLIITTQPFWMVGFEALLPGGERLHAPPSAAWRSASGGIVPVYAGGGGMASTQRAPRISPAASRPGGVVVRVHLSAAASGKAHSVIAGAVQQLAAGLVLAPFAMAIHEHPVHWSARGVGALLYLVCFGRSWGTARMSTPWTGCPWPSFRSTPT